MKRLRIPPLLPHEKSSMNGTLMTIGFTVAASIFLWIMTGAALILCPDFEPNFENVTQSTCYIEIDPIN